MSPTLLAVVALAALAVIAHTLPTPHLAHHKPRIMDLTKVLNHTVCPIEVSVDINPKRIPRRIKMLKCAPDPNKWCNKEKIPQNECCQHKHNDHQMECVQLQDTVLVQNADGTQGLFEVLVGCSCMINESPAAKNLAVEPS